MFSINQLTKCAFALVIAASSALCSAQNAIGAPLKGSKLKPCVGTNTETWSKCTGRVELENGRVLLGEYLNGNLHGKGIATNPNGGGGYTGDFEAGKYHGSGVLDFGTGKAKITGKFVDGITNGFGVINFVDGDRYEGNIVGNQRQGAGTNFFQSGAEVGCKWEKNNCSQFLPSPKVNYRVIFGCSDKYAQGVDLDRAQVLLREYMNEGADYFSRMIFSNGYEMCSGTPGRTIAGINIDYEKATIKKIEENGKVFFIYKFSDTLTLGMTN